MVLQLRPLEPILPRAPDERMLNHIPCGFDAVDRRGLVEDVRCVVGDDHLGDYKKMCNLAVCRAPGEAPSAMDVQVRAFHHMEHERFREGCQRPDVPTYRDPKGPISANALKTAIRQSRASAPAHVRASPCD